MKNKSGHLARKGSGSTILPKGECGKGTDGGTVAFRSGNSDRPPIRQHSGFVIERVQGSCFGLSKWCVLKKTSSLNITWMRGCAVTFVLMVLNCVIGKYIYQMLNHHCSMVRFKAGFDDCA